MLRVNKLVQDISGVPPSRQVLFCHRSKMGHDKLETQLYGLGVRVLAFVCRA